MSKLFACEPNLEMVLFTLLFILCWAGISYGQATGDVYGKVSEEVTARPLVEAKIKLLGTSYSTRTDTFGDYFIRSVPVGDYRIKIQLAGYLSGTVEVEIKEGRETRCDLRLKPAILETGQEIVIKAKRRSTYTKTAVSQKRINGEAIVKTSSDLFPDLTQTLRTLPGVNLAGDFDAAMYVRGGFPIETSFLLDRVFIPYPYHWHGRTTMFNPRLIEKVDFYTGGLPAEYGNSLAGVLDVDYREGDQDNFKGTGELSTTTLDLQLEGPLSRWNKAGWLASARRTHYDFLLSTLLDEVSPNFWEIYGKLSFHPVPGRSFSLSGLVWGEGLGLEDKYEYGYEKENYDFTQGLLIFNWKEVLSKRAFVQTTMAPSCLRGKYIYDDRYDNYYWRHEEWKTTLNGFLLREDITLFPHPRHNLKAGVGLWLADVEMSEKEVEYDTRKDDELTVIDVYEDREDIRYRLYSVYLWDRWKVGKPLSLDLGLRYEYLKAKSSSMPGELTPRIGITLSPDDKIGLKVVYAESSQFPLDPYQFDEGIRAQRGRDCILGFERELAPNSRLRIEAYYKDLRRLIIDDQYGYDYNGGRGFAKGIELWLEKGSGKWDGWISYSMASSKRRFGYSDIFFELPEEDVRPSPDDATLYPTFQDRRHVLNVVANYRFTPKWELGLRWRIATGTPYTSILMMEKVEFERNGRKYWRYYPVWADFRSERLPSYQRLDLRLSRDFRWWGRKGVWYIQVLNLYNHNNVSEYDYSVNYEDGSFTEEFEEGAMFGLLPLIGVEVKF